MNFYETNPFQVLYVTDSPDARVFVELFSDVPVLHATALFQPGNVVLQGTQGSGKSMLLNLLHPSIRLEYAKLQKQFPVPGDLTRFVGAGINLTLSGALNVGQRPIDSTGDEESLFPLYFADFVNYYVIRDLLNSLELMASNTSSFDDMVDGTHLDDFAKCVSKDDCWFGFLESATDFASLKQQIDKRLASYRAFHQYNSDLLEEVSTTKTAIGEPIARCVDWLRETNVLDGETPVFVRIDQIERLYRSDVVRPALGQAYRRIINKALGSRDSRVSYRVGTRPYAWDDDLTIFGTEDQLEVLRDYRGIDLDRMLRRQEDVSTWIFPEFARDAFARRLRHGGLDRSIAPDSEDQDYLRCVFGPTPQPRQVAAEYSRNSSAKRALRLDPEWPEAWRTFLTEQFAEDPLSAVLAAAWARQGTRGQEAGERLSKPPPVDQKPWAKATWRNERTRQALLQIAARCAQRLKWSGKDAVLALSSGNISIFLSICYEIWDAFLRSERQKVQEDRSNPVEDGISPNIQAVGIQTASTHWHGKIAERPKGHDRQRFIDVLGRTFRKMLLDDNAMSYPGSNGFSLTIDELDSVANIKQFLQEAVDYGDLYDSAHTTKEKSRKPRRKWYLAPILSVAFQIPEAHKKEPYYATISDVKQWIDEANVVLPSPQMVFPFADEGETT